MLLKHFCVQRLITAQVLLIVHHQKVLQKQDTYSQSGTTVTITITDHGVATNDVITIDYTSGSAVDGTFVVASVTSTSVFTVVAAASATNSGNVSITLAGARKYVCDQWSKQVNFANRATINATFREVFEP